MFYSNLAIAALSASIATVATYRIQETRYEAKEADRVKSELVNVRLSAAASIRRADNVIASQNEATTRMVRLRRDADNSRTQSSGLRAQLTEARKLLSDASCPTSRDYADTVSELFDQCQDRYRSVAEKADGHASDAKTLRDAWPKE